VHFVPPRTMMDFFRKSEGTWFIQRQVHHFDRLDDESGASNLIVQVVPPDDPRVVSICAQQAIDPAQAKGGGAFLWQDNLDDATPNPDYAAVLIDVPDDETGLSGKLIRDRGYVEKMPVISRYWFGQDGILTIDTEYDTNQGQERSWFITDDFRVRVSTVRTISGVNLMTYCSERRCLPQDRLEGLIQRNLVREPK
jgi:hypothetical protein